MRRIAKLGAGLMYVMAGIVGCGEPAARPTTSQAAPPPPPAPPVIGAATETTPEPATKTIEPGDDVVKAEAGVGKKGQGYGGGIITEPIRQRFLIEDRLNFERMKHALELYKAANEGLPKTHEAFMRDIIEANEIRLPELPAGQEYVYDPKAGELMVRRPE